AAAAGACLLGTGPAAWAAVEPAPSPTVTDQPAPAPSPSPVPTTTEEPGAGEGETTTPVPTLEPEPTPTAPEPQPSVTAEPVPEPSPESEPVVVERPATPPAASTSQIGVGQVLTALLVLAAALLVVRAVRRRAAPGGEVGAPVRPGSAAPPTVRGEASPEALVGFLVALGEAMIDSGDLVSHVTTSLEDVARVNGSPDAQVVVLPTALIVTIPGADTVRTAVSAAGTARLRLDQIDAVSRLTRAAERGELDPASGLTAIRAARATEPPFGPWVQVVGYSVLTVGLALVLRAGWVDVVVAAVLGTAVGLLQVRSHRMGPTTQVFMPVLSAFTVAVAVFLLAARIPELEVFAPVVAPLVTFLPGALLTTAVIELSTGQMVSGAGRLAAGGMQLMLLAFGIVAAGQLVGVPASTLTAATGPPLGPWTPWLGVAAFGVGVALHYGARLSFLGWILLVLFVAYAGQVLGGLLLGGVLSAFVGALLMTPVAVFAAAQRSGPPVLVSFLPAFWLLVPGALGLVGVTQLLSADRVDGTGSLITAAATMVGIAFGVLLGLAAGAGAVATVGTLSARRRGADPAA
ncbi:MAG TPA: threonine/serine exporter family protein, partial [Actinotalea sp.]|nr:threonine/serine exporter family protein [Actinotalea sp.]